jgi:hypothetical protein
VPTLGKNAGSSASENTKFLPLLAPQGKLDA